MNLDFNISNKWNDLNFWQLQKIADVLYSDKPEKITNFLLVSYLFIRKPSVKNVLKFLYLLFNVPFSELKKHCDFLYNETNFTKFLPELKNLKGPYDRLANLTIEEFSYADLFYYNWATTKDLQDLNRLVCVLYRPVDKATKERRTFKKEELAKHSTIIEALPKSIKLVVAMAYQGSRELIINRSKNVFSSGKKKTPYIPFSKIVNEMARSENQPFGDFYKTKSANVHDFFELLDEERKSQKERERNFKKNK
ncbi:conserved hypothetical protein [Tenacibaculum sp. 190524A02b]|uniref:Uncharacterized protein n=1 Tax=Tenacibaculum vairaonense TaxID=3137860 RepID=A0ABM9PIM7_9FLAO